MSEIQGEAPLIATHTATSRRVLYWDEGILTAVLALLLLALIGAGTHALPMPWSALRLLLSLWFLLFAPGYALQAAVFLPAEGSGDVSPETMDRTQRLTLSFGLSLAVDAAIALLLDRLPWGIRLWPIVIAESLVIGTATAVALYRRRNLPRYLPGMRLDPKGWWKRQGGRDRIIYALSALAALMSVIAAGSIMTSVPPSERFSEFYILGSEGQAERYPYSATIGSPVTVTLGIANHEGVSTSYRAEVRDDGILVGSVQAVSLEPGEKREIPVRLAPLTDGADVPMTFLLYRDDARTPYRSLRLWLEVKAEP